MIDQADLITLLWTVAKILAICVPLIICVAFYTLAERKVIGWMQVRRGPQYVGPFGILQPFADVVKLLIKEIVVPKDANKFLFYVAPVLAMAPAFAAWAVVRARGFLRGIVAAGMVGFGLALVFLFHGAPDLAFTQFSVEAVAIVVLLAIAGRMPFAREDARTAPQRRLDAAIAIGFGAVASLLLLSVLASPFDGRLSDFFRAASVPEAHGRNLVNVIIVDFRALDTLGEITVLALAALAAAAVLAGTRRSRGTTPSPDEEEGAA